MAKIFERSNWKYYPWMPYLYERILDMKIIKEGSHVRQIVFTGTCKSCGAEVECEESELKHIRYDQCEDGELAEVKCPTTGCKAKFWVYRW